MCIFKNAISNEIYICCILLLVKDACFEYRYSIFSAQTYSTTKGDNTIILHTYLQARHTGLMYNTFTSVMHTLSF